jgi:hypothetical protein
MDQVKVYLGVAKKHHFWILVAVVIITALVVWIKASGSLAAQYETNKKTIESAENSVKQAGSSGELVNDKFKKKVDDLHEGLKQHVFDAWKTLYERQVALFRWPIEKTRQGVIDLNSLKPDEEIQQYVRTYYNENVLEREWTEILDKVDLRRRKEVDSPKSELEEGADEEEAVVKRGAEYEGLVVWKEDLRKAIVSRYYTPNVTPSSNRLRMMQQDAWLFESLINVINTVNVGATDPLRAPIKEIDVLDVAQWAIAASLQSGGSSNSTGGMMGGGMGAGGSGMPAGGSAAMQTGGGAAAGGTSTTSGASGDGDKEWEDGRYLDEKGQPLKAGGPDPFIEFRQMFVYMKFIMDQRRIPDLVAACANAPLPIETRQVRVQTLKGDGGAGGGGGLFPSSGGGMTGAGMSGSGAGGSAPPGMTGGGMMGGGMAGGGMMGGGMMGPRSGGSAPPGMTGGGMMGGGMMGGGMMGGGMMGGGMMGGGMMGGGMMGDGMMGGFGAGNDLGTLEGGVETTVYDGIVELSGVIYLYNPPDITKLGQGAAGSPEKRTFGVPKTAPHLPGMSGGGGMTGGGMMGGGAMGGGATGGGATGGGATGGGATSAAGGAPAQAPAK